MKYEVTDPNGLIGFNGKRHAQGDILEESEIHSGHKAAWLRFQQIKEVKPGAKKKEETKKEATKPDDKPNTNTDPNAGKGDEKTKAGDATKEKGNKTS